MNHTLVCPFLTDDPQFAHGVEIGILYTDMKCKRRIHGLYHRANQEQIILMTNRLGWTILELEREQDRKEEWTKDWFWISMEKKDAQK